MLTISNIPLRIAQVSDIHVGGSLSLPAEALEAILEQIRRIEPDLVVIPGDLTTDGYEWEYEEAARWVEQVEFPKIVIPGNHDSRNVGYVLFRRFFGEPYSSYRASFDPVRAERLQATGFTIAGLDS
jgi:Icc protein